MNSSTTKKLMNKCLSVLARNNDGVKALVKMKEKLRFMGTRRIQLSALPRVVRNADGNFKRKQPSYFQLTAKTDSL